MMVSSFCAPYVADSSAIWAPQPHVGLQLKQT